MFLIAALNNLDILTCDILNLCLYAPCHEKIWFIGGKDTGEEKHWLLFGLKSSGASW